MPKLAAAHFDCSQLVNSVIWKKDKIKIKKLKVYVKKVDNHFYFPVQQGGLVLHVKI